MGGAHGLHQARASGDAVAYPWKAAVAAARARARPPGGADMPEDVAADIQEQMMMAAVDAYDTRGIGWRR